MTETGWLRLWHYALLSRILEDRLELETLNDPCMSAVMGFDRQIERDCWVMVPSLPPKGESETYCCCLGRGPEGWFHSLGYCGKSAWQWIDAHLKRFVSTDFDWM